MEPGGACYTYTIDRDLVMAELAKREHLPNKEERRGTINKSRGKQKRKLKYGK